MPEGPSIVIVAEELAGFKKKVILKVLGNTKTDKDRLVGQKILGIFSYGKYLNFQFKDFGFRIHFMLFGSYRVNEEREDKAPRLRIQFKKGTPISTAVRLNSLKQAMCAIRSISLWR